MHARNWSLALKKAYRSARLRLQAFASKPEAFESLLDNAFGSPRRSGQEVMRLRQILAQGLWPWRIELSEESGMENIRAAYAGPDSPGGERILINSRWASSVSVKAIEAVLLHEAGHAIDKLLNPENDAQGEEGERFSSLIRGFTPIPSVPTENDHKTLQVGKTSLTVESSALPVWTRLWGTVNDDKSLGVASGTDGSLVVTSESARDKFSLDWDGLTQKSFNDGSSGTPIGGGHITNSGTGLEARVAATSDGGFIWIGNTEEATSRNSSGVVSRYDSNLSLIHI